MAKKKYETIDITTLDKDLIFDSKFKKNALDFGNKTPSTAFQSITANDNDLVITTKSTGNHTITLKDYFAQNGKHPVKYLCYTGTTSPDTEILSYVNDRNIKGTAQTITTADKKGKMYGTVFNDAITGTVNADSIYGYGGNDTINGSLGADTIIGGTTTGTSWNHADRVVYTSLDQLDGDKIKLTKGERLVADVSGVSYDSYELNVNGKDLDVTLIKGENKATFTILDFGTKDVSNNETKSSEDTSVVGLCRKGDPFNYWLDLKTAVVNSDKGTWHNDNIDKSGYQIKKKGQVVTDVNNKGLTINGGAGNDTIVGTIYKDTIKAGTGETETITGGTGNDALYASTTVGSNTTFKFSAGDGKDTVYSGKGEDTIELNGINLTDLVDKFVRGTTKKTKNDLTINYTDNDSVTIKNFYAVDKNKKPTTSIKYIKTNEGTFDLAAAVNVIISEGAIEGTDNPEVIYGSAGNDTINAKEGNDEIYGMGGKDTIYAGAGDDIVHVIKGTEADNADIHLGTGDDTVLLDAGTVLGTYHNAHIYFEKDHGNNTLDLSNTNNHGKIYLNSKAAQHTYGFNGGLPDYQYYVGEKDGKDLVLDLEGTDETFTIKNWYESTSATAIATQEADAVLNPYMDESNQYSDGPDNFVRDHVFHADQIKSLGDLATITGSNQLYIAGATGSAREITIGDYKNSLMVTGSNTQTVNIVDTGNILYIKNTGTGADDKNVINVDNEYNSIHAYGKTKVTIDASECSNFVRLYDGNNSIIATSPEYGNTIVDVNVEDVGVNHGYARVYSFGTDDITLRKGDIDICFDGSLQYPGVKSNGQEKNITNTSESARVTLHDSKLAGDINITQNLKHADEPDHMMFVHNTAAAEKNTLYVRYYNEDDGMLNSIMENGLQINGTWAASGRSGSTWFDADAATDAAVANRITVTAQNDAGSVTQKLSQMDQAVYLQNSASFNFADNETNGLLSIRKGTFIVASTENHNYQNYSFAGNDGQVTIKDLGGTDSLSLDMTRNDYRFFIDFYADGHIIDSDLLIFKHSGTSIQDGLKRYLGYDGHALDLDNTGEFIKIKNAFDTTASTYTGAGAIETISDTTKASFAVDAYVNTIKGDIVNWISDYNAAHIGADCTTVSEAVSRGMSVQEWENLCAIYANDTAWGTY